MLGHLFTRRALILLNPFVSLLENIGEDGICSQITSTHFRLVHYISQKGIHAIWTIVGWDSGAQLKNDDNPGKIASDLQYPHNIIFSRVLGL